MTKQDKIKYLEELEDLEYQKAEKNLYAFFKSSWEVLSPTTNLLYNWHQELIAEHLTACFRRQIKRLIINIQPRSLKSTLASIDFPAWCWTDDPSEKFMFASYSQGLAFKHSEDRKTLIKSNWYNSRWGDKFCITKDATQLVKNDKAGHIIATSLRGTAVGLGANILGIDDPHDVQKVHSDKIRETDIEIFDKKLYNRLDDKTNGVIIIIMQRCHEADLTGHLLKENEGYTHLKIPTIAEKKTIIDFPISGMELERPEGNILHEERENEIAIEKQKKKGDFYFSGQYQQNPSPTEGGIIKTKWFQFYNKLPEKFDYVIDSWDLAVKDKEVNDDACGIVWGVKGSLKYILGLIKKKMGFVTSLKELVLMREKFQLITKSIIEDKANGSPVIEVLKQKLDGIIAFNPKVDKMTRLMLCQPDFEAGQILLPSKDIATFDTETLMNSLSKFPNIANDDDVDALTTGLIYIKTQHKEINIEFFG